MSSLIIHPTIVSSVPIDLGVYYLLMYKIISKDNGLSLIASVSSLNTLKI